jgi:outer membrane protein TolC
VHRLRALNVVIGCLLAGAPAAASAEQEETVGSSPLEWAVSRALASDLGLRQTRSQLQATVAEARILEARGRPILTLESRSSRMGGGIELGELLNPAYGALNELLGQPRFPTDLSLPLPYRQEAVLRLGVSVLNPELRGARAAAEARTEAMAWSSDARARQVATEAQQALLWASQTRAERQILDAAAERVEEAERVARRLVDEGLETDDAILRAQADRAELEGLRAAARAREAAAALDYQRRIGGEPGIAAPELSEAALLRLPAFFPEPLTLRELESRALSGSSVLRTFEALQEAAEGGLQAARGARRPVVALQAEAALQGDTFNPWQRDDRWMASVVVRLPLLTGGESRARIDLARADQARIADASAEGVEGILLGVRIAHERYLAALAALPAAEARLAASEEIHRLLMRRTEEGLATPLELSMARAALTAAQLGRVVALHDVALNRVALEAAAALRPLPSPLAPSGREP